MKFRHVLILAVAIGIAAAALNFSPWISAIAGMGIGWHVK